MKFNGAPEYVPGDLEATEKWVQWACQELERQTQELKRQTRRIDELATENYTLTNQNEKLETAVKGLEAALALKRGPQVYEPGSTVYLVHDHTPVVIERVGISRSSVVSYQITYWVKNLRYSNWVYSSELIEEPPLPIRPQ